MNFFPNVDLAYLKEKLMESGIPQDISEYLTVLNQSLVVLNNEDLIPEPHREIIFNSDGSPNPNLPKDIRDRIQEDPKFVEILKKRGFKEIVTNGVPQGASTSCGLATYNLKELFKKYKELIMYADDGILCREDPSTPDFSIKKAGVYQEPAKSGWLKRDGVFEKSVKFLGLEFIPANISPLDGSEVKDYPRLRGATRDGSKMELTPKLQFLCYISEKLHLERERRSLARCTIGEFLTNSFEEFKGLPPIKRIGFFFSSPTGPTILSSIYNNSMNLQEPSDSRLLYRKGSWVNIRFASYLYNILSNRVLLPLSLERLLEVYREMAESNPDKVDNTKIEAIERLLEFSRSTAYNEVGVLALMSLFKFRDSKRENIKEGFKNLRENGKISEFIEVRSQ